MISSTGKSGYMVKRANSMTASGAGNLRRWQMSGSRSSIRYPQMMVCAEMFLVMALCWTCFPSIVG